MISLVIPTRDRAHTLKRVGEAFYAVKGVDEVIFVDDAGSDDTPAVLAALAAGHPTIKTQVLRNERRRGAGFSRNRGVAAASNDMILFCDDDMLLDSDYAETCRAKLEGSDAAIVAGRLIYMRGNETPAEAAARFGSGCRLQAPFDTYTCRHRVDACFTGDIRPPLTHAVILTTKALLERLPFDPHYSRGNGYREESDFQMNAFLHGNAILVTNDTRCFHLPAALCRGGQRVNRLAALFWSVRYTAYFYRKYYDRYAARVGLGWPRPLALGWFALHQGFDLFLRPLPRLVLGGLRRLGIG